MHPAQPDRTQIGHWKSVLGLRLKSLRFSRQITEIQRGHKILNTTTDLSRSVFGRTARRCGLGQSQFCLRPRSVQQYLRGGNRQHFPPLPERRALLKMKGAL